MKKIQQPKSKILKSVKCSSYLVARNETKVEWKFE